MGDRRDEAVGFQQPQRLTDGWPADARHLAKLPFDQALARLQLSGHDGFA